jgi:hypothetical protein
MRRKGRKRASWEGFAVLRLRLPAGRLYGMFLLRDLRQLHLAIEESAMLWLIVGQGVAAVGTRSCLRSSRRVGRRSRTSSCG